MGLDSFRIEFIWDTLLRRTFWGQSPGRILIGAMSAIDEALWDIKGKALGVSLDALIAGKLRRRPGSAIELVDDDLESSAKSEVA